MTQNRIQGRFYPLQSEEWLETVKQLTHSELKVLYYIRSLDPYNKGISLTPVQIASDLSTEKCKMHRSTVTRALKSLDNQGFIQMELLQIQIKVNPKGFLSQAEIEDVAVKQPSCEQATESATTQPSVPDHNLECSQATESATTQQLKAETISETGFQTPKIYKTYIDFKDSLSENEGENYLKFAREAIKNFKQPIHDLEAWLASKTKAGTNRWEVYFEKYQSETKARKFNSDSSSVPDQERQRAIAKYQESLKQQKSQSEKIEHGKRKEEIKLESLLNNPKYQIKSIEGLKSQEADKSTPKALGRYVAEGKEKLRELRTNNYFADRAIQGGKR
jgi:hypothetical protein